MYYNIVYKDILNVVCVLRYFERLVKLFPVAGQVWRKIIKIIKFNGVKFAWGLACERRNELNHLPAYLYQGWGWTVWGEGIESECEIKKIYIKEN